MLLSAGVHEQHLVNEDEGQIPAGHKLVILQVTTVGVDMQLCCRFPEYFQVLQRSGALSHGVKKSFFRASRSGVSSLLIGHCVDALLG